MHDKPELFISSRYWTQKLFDNHLHLLSLNTTTHTSVVTVFIFWMLSTRAMLKNVFQIHLSSALGPFPLFPWGYMCTQLKKESGLNFQFMVWELILHVDTAHHWVPVEVLWWTSKQNYLSHWVLWVFNKMDICSPHLGSAKLYQSVSVA